MTHSFLQLLIYALATYRLTRLVTTDSITQPMRTRLYNRAYVLMERRNAQATEQEYRRRENVSVAYCLHTLVTCDWCTSIWTAGGCTVLWRNEASWWLYVAAALALSAIVGLVSDRLAH